MSFMRLARVLCFALVPAALAGCLSEGTRARLFNSLPLLGTGNDANSAQIQYVIIERRAGTEEINRRAWDRVDETLLPFEARDALADVGLRVGTAGESAPGVLRHLIDDPRTAWGHRARTFALDRPVPLLVNSTLPHAEFSMPTADLGTSAFSHEGVVLGFEITVRDGPEGKSLVKLVPRARYRDPSQILPADIADRGLATETFPIIGFEIALAPSEYLVIGTDHYWAGTFGHAAFTGTNDELPVQRLLVLRASRAKSKGDGIHLSDDDDQALARPIASQAGTVRGTRP
jgi:hypothetical protein